ncbi:MAG: hypothetical protein LBU34_13105, partial [Planctomycetaceae bacterium]|nr:hypothetical protein [Planctomycetaceae bacterium]
MSDLDREMLLGYLMNALEDDEIAYVERELLCQPDMRTELATLQKELSPLTYVYESVDPPHNLAQHTCRQIWKHLDRTKQKNVYVRDSVSEMPLGSIITMAISASHLNNDGVVTNRSNIGCSVPNSPTLNSSEVNSLIPYPAVNNCSETPEKILTVLPSQPAIPATIPTENSQSIKYSNSKRLIRRSSHNRGNSAVSSQKPIGKNRRWFDISISIAVGILIAVITFPVVNYVRNQTQNYFTQSKIHEINKSIDHYTQLQGKAEKTTPIENSSPINLTQSDWQELKPAQLPVMLTGEPVHSSDNSTSIEKFPGLLKSVSQNAVPFVSSDFSSNSRGRDIILGQTRTDNFVAETFPPDSHEFIDQTLISRIDPFTSNF